jgi:hypothetical protein
MINSIQQNNWRAWEKRTSLYANGANTEMNLRYFLLSRTINLSKSMTAIPGLPIEINQNIEVEIAKINNGLSKLKIACDNVNNQQLFLRFGQNDFDIVSDKNDQEPLTDFSGFGVAPLIVGAGIFAVIVAGAWSTLKVCEYLTTKTNSDLKIAQLKAEQAFANSTPLAQQAWKNFKSLQKPVEDKISALDSLKDSVSSFLGSAGSLVLFGLAAMLAFKLFKKE